MSARPFRTSRTDRRLFDPKARCPYLVYVDTAIDKKRISWLSNLIQVDRRENPTSTGQSEGLCVADQHLGHVWSHDVQHMSSSLMSIKILNHHLFPLLHWIFFLFLFLERVTCVPMKP